MSAKKISRFPVPDLKELQEDIRERILAVQEKSGFVPNVFLAWESFSLDGIWIAAFVSGTIIF